MIDDRCRFDSLTQGLLFEGVCILYHPLTHSTVIGRRNLYESWKSNSTSQLDDDTTQKLIDEKLLCVHEDIVFNKVHDILEEWLNTPTEIQQVYLVLNDVCNFRCRYCRQTIRDNHANNMMSKEIAFSYIDMLNSSKSTTKNKGIVFYGGEPMLSKKLIIQCVDYVRNDLKNKSMEMTIITNGTNIDAETANYLAENDVFIIVSIDGQLDENDKMRVDHDGNGTFNKIIDGLKIYTLNGCKVGISCTLGKHNISNLKETLSYFRKLNVINLGINLPHDDHQNPIWPNREDDWLQCTLDELWEATRNGLYIEHIIRKLRLYVTQHIRISECPSVGGRLVILPDNRIGVCEGAMGNNEFFNSADDKEWLEGEIERWKNSVPLLDSGCRNCIALGICGGGCPLDGYFENKVLSAKGSVRCEFYQKLMIKTLKTIAEINYEKIGSSDCYVITKEDRAALYLSMVRNKSPKPLEISAVYGEFHCS